MSIKILFFNRWALRVYCVGVNTGAACIRTEVNSLKNVLQKKGKSFVKDILWISASANT